MTQDFDPLDAIAIAHHIANHISGPVQVTYLDHAKGGSQIGQKPQAGQSYTIVYPDPSKAGTASHSEKRRLSMARYRVLVDVDENGGDDDVFSIVVYVEAPTPDEAMAKAEARAAIAYGKHNVLGASDARELV